MGFKLKACLEEDVTPQKVHLVDGSLLMHHRVKSGMMTVSFSHFDRCFAYKLRLKANNQEVTYRGLTRQHGETCESAVAYFPKALRASLVKEGSQKLEFSLKSSPVP